MTTYNIPSGGTIAVPSSLTVRAVATAPGYTPSAEVDATYTISASGGGPLFPLFGMMCISGGVPPAGSLAALAPYPLVIISINGGPISRQAAASGIKSHVVAGTKTAVKPMIVQYNLFNQLYPTSYGLNLDWINIVNAHNWKLYASGSSGTPISSDQGVVVDICDVVGQASGLYPYEWAAQWFHDAFISGGGLSTSSTNVAPAIDAYYMDNASPDCYGLAADDWLRNGNSSTTTQKIAAYATAVGQFADKLKAIDPSRPAIGNTTYGYSQTRGGQFGPINGKFAYPMMQWIFGRAFVSSVVMANGGPGQVMTYYKGCVASSSNGSAQMTGGFSMTDYGLMRAALCLTLMDNGYAIFGTHGTSYSGDTIDASQPASFPLIDEFWGGALNKGGFMGRRVGAVQTGPVANGVWRADFDNCIALWNSTGAPATVPALGGTFYHLRNNIGAQAINNAAATTGGFTLGTLTQPTATGSRQIGDGCVLMRTPT
jgi:hypothetical protein